MYKAGIGEYKAKKMKFKDAVKLFHETCSLKIQPPIVKYCYCMSKMTVCNEETEYANYDKIKFVEFLEMVARVAIEYARNHLEIKNANLESKMEVVLDSLFEVIGEERREVVIPDPDISDSDPDY